MEYTREYLQKLIDGQVEESSTLEYKAGGELKRTDDKARVEMTKDISAFANAAGGTLIYGIGEFSQEAKKHLPEKFVPVDQSAFSREWVDQRAGLIRPKIDPLQIFPVHVGPGVSDYCYVLEIPQSTTAHQAFDCRYYKRRNFESTMMEDYEIRDVMNRQKHPSFAAEVKLTHGVHGTILHIHVTNCGVVMASQIGMTLRLPLYIGDREIIVKENDSVQISEFNGMRCTRSRVTTSIRPFFPGDDKTYTLALGGIICPESEMELRLPDLDGIYLTLFADNMPKLELKKDWTAASAGWV